MSFITDIVKYGLGQAGIQVKGDSPNEIASSAITSFLTERVNAAIKKANPARVSESSASTANSQQEVVVKQEFAANTNANIPVVYGEGYVDPILIDVQLTNKNCTMWYVVALAEVTGTTIAGDDSLITFEEIYWEGKKLTFDYDGVSVTGAYEGRGVYAKQDLSLNGNVKIYCYNDGSESPCNIRPQGLEVTHGNAYEIMPLWTDNHLMSKLAFAIIRVDYDAENDVSGINNLKFKLRNSLKQPGDVIYDYMSNSRYGAGVPAASLDVSNLNTYGNQSISFTDSRPTDVLFTIPSTNNQAVVIYSQTSPITRAFDILDIIQDVAAGVEFIIDISNLTGATLNWGTTPAGVTISESSGVYTAAGITTTAIWDLIKDPILTLPDTIQGEFNYDVNVNYNNSRGAQVYGYQVTAYIPVMQLNLTSNLTAVATII